MKNILIILFCSFCLICNGQLNTYTIEKDKHERVITPYDSLSNGQRSNLPSLIGQKIQIIPQKKTSDLATGITLYTALPSGFDNNKLVVKPDKRFSIYKSQFGAFDNEIFEIIGVDSINRRGPIELFFIVKNENYPTPHYLSLGWVNDQYSNGKLIKRGEIFTIDYVVLGYIEKKKQLEIGRKFVNTHPNNKAVNSDYIIYDLSSGKPLQGPIPENYVWTVEDIGLVQGGAYTGLCYILKSEDYPLCYTNLSINGLITYENFKQQEDNRKQQEMTRKQWESEMIKKYGKINGELIIQGKVKIGFTKQMCIEAWGNPTSINKSTGSWGVHEQWVYGYGSYLYFENGKLTSIDN